MDGVINSILFPAPPSSYTFEDFPKELIWIPKNIDFKNKWPEHCEKIPAIFLRCPSARFVIYFCHGNAEDIGRCYHFCNILRRQFQVHVMAIEYPGYGLAPGETTAENVIQNVLSGFNFIINCLKWPLDGIKIMGRSIGTGPALFLASQYNVSGLILVSPFLSIRDVANDNLPFSKYIIKERFPNNVRIRQVSSPTLIIHGHADVLIPQYHGQTLFEKCSAVRKKLVSPLDMEHNSNLFRKKEAFETSRKPAHSETAETAKRIKNAKLSEVSNPQRAVAARAVCHGGDEPALDMDEDASETIEDAVEEILADSLGLFQYQMDSSGFDNFLDVLNAEDVLDAWGTEDPSINGKNKYSKNAEKSKICINMADILLPDENN
eukprot:GHVL01010875.1.p1 GENE.GHVL01010875.1~~GHVL01010875.1.p1  ORF type:complete len:378 (+),score=75.65 GHVL01010875.1:96-1229(+)